MKPIEIIDIIDHRSKYAIRRMLVVDRMPKITYEKKGQWLHGHGNGCFSFYHYEAPGPTWKAFGGSKFDIPMSDGSVIEASGQWWDACPAEFRDLTYSLGVATIDGLSQCYVFYGGIYTDREIVDAWLAGNEPSNNYHKYDRRPLNSDYGKHTIKSQWGQT